MLGLSSVSGTLIIRGGIRDSSRGCQTLDGAQTVGRRDRRTARGSWPSGPVRSSAHLDGGDVILPPGSMMRKVPAIAPSTCFMMFWAASPTSRPFSRLGDSGRNINEPTGPSWFETDCNHWLTTGRAYDLPGFRFWNEGRTVVQKKLNLMETFPGTTVMKAIIPGSSALS